VIHSESAGSTEWIEQKAPASSTERARTAAEVAEVSEEAMAIECSWQGVVEKNHIAGTFRAVVVQTRAQERLSNHRLDILWTPY
jgi:hypothetical protein